jgi:hypothetical protein
MKFIIIIIFKDLIFDDAIYLLYFKDLLFHFIHFVNLLYFEIIFYI